jgi:hypothetical protein
MSRLSKSDASNSDEVCFMHAVLVGADVAFVGCEVDGYFSSGSRWSGFFCCKNLFVFVMVEQDGQGKAAALLNENYAVVEKVPSLSSKTTEVLSSDTGSDSGESAKVQDNDFSQTVGFNYGADCSDVEEIVDKDFSQTAMIDLEGLECNLAGTKLKTVDTEDEDSEEEELAEQGLDGHQLEEFRQQRQIQRRRAGGG